MAEPARRSGGGGQSKLPLPFWLSYPLTANGTGTGLEVGTVNVVVLGVLSHVLVGLFGLNHMSRANERKIWIQSQ